ncbi:MAG: ABC transporter substrate-binding protein [Dehalococcoidia bacterium]
MRSTHLARRRVLRATVLGGAGLGGLALLACRGDSSGTARQATAEVGRSETRAATQEQALPGGTYNWFIAANPPSLDPHRTSAVTTMTSVSPVMSRLLRFKSGKDVAAGYNRETQPDLAQTVESPDAVTWTVKLRQGAAFHNVPPVNGHAVEAEDVKASFTRALDPKNPNRGSLTFIDPAQIETPATDTVAFKLTHPYAPFPKLLASGVYSWIFPREALAGDYDPAKQIIGSGPFLFESFTPDVAATYTKNPAWFEQGKPYVDSVRRAVVPDPAQRLAQFSAGNLDAVGVPLDDLETMRRRNPEAELITERDQGGPVLYFQLDEPSSPWQDARLRRAVSLAIDRAAFANAHLKGQWNPSFNVPLNSGKWALTLKDLPPETAQWYTFDRERARKLLTEAGGVDMNVKLLYPIPHPRDPYLKSAAETIFSMLSALPWRISLVFIDYNKDWVGGGKGVRYGNFPPDSMVLTGIEGRTDVDEYLYGWWHSKSTSAISRLKDPRLDATIEKARSLLDEQERVKTSLEAQTYIAEQTYSAMGTPSGFDFTLVQPTVINHTTGDSYGVGTGQWAQLWLKR